jgi:hypothetical protein
VDLDAQVPLQWYSCPSQGSLGGPRQQSASWHQLRRDLQSGCQTHNYSDCLEYCCVPWLAASPSRREECHGHLEETIYCSSCLVSSTLLLSTMSACSKSPCTGSRRLLGRGTNSLPHFFVSSASPPPPLKPPSLFTKRVHRSPTCCCTSTTHPHCFVFGSSSTHHGQTQF